MDNLGSAPKWRLGLGLDHLVKHYKTYGLDIVFRTGSAEKVLTELISETHANQVIWARTYLPPLNDRDARIKVVLKQKGILAKSFPGHLLFCLLYTSPSPRDATLSRMPSSA